MATFMAPAIESCKEKSFDSVNGENEKDTSCNSIDAVDKKDTCNERSAFYKKPIKKNNYKLEVDFNDTPQEIRRQRILHYQKKNRDASFNAGRGLLEDVLNSENEEEMEEEEEEELEEMDVDQYKKKRHKIRKDYARMFMLSEWMLEVPQDFADNWIMVPCPVGKRVLLVAHKGLTKMYTRKGVQISTFKTLLPGGSPRTCKNSCTILDCIWIKDKEECYVLDVIAWSNQEMLNCETEFRFYWLKSQLEEYGELQINRKGMNECSIIPLPIVTCDHDFYECLQSVSTTFSLDGLLFFHKQGHYTSGRTPLVAWLKGYMLPEVLGMSVPEQFDEKPASYVDFDTHVLKVIQAERSRLKNMQKQNKQSKKPEQEDME